MHKPEPSIQVTTRVDVTKLASIQLWLESRGWSKRSQAHLLQTVVNELWKALVRSGKVENIDSANAWAVLERQSELEEGGIEDVFMRADSAKNAIEAMLREEDEDE